jgi:GNAT superfamily N-acetyltransferase
MAYDSGLNMEERVSSLFQPDTLLPEQYLDTFRRKVHLEPEKKLLLAILEDAIACYQKYIFARDGKGKALFREAESWVGEKGNEAVFAFDSVCEMLGFDPEYLRRGLATWTVNAVAQHNPAKVVQLAPRLKKSRGNVALARRPGRRLKRVVNR